MKKIPIIVYLVIQFTISGECANYKLPMYAADRDEQIGYYEIQPQSYRRLVENGYLPARNTFMTDVEIAQKLDLSLPQLAEVKRTLEKGDGIALQKALADYLSTRLSPFNVESPPKPVPNADHPDEWQRPDAWLGSEITYKHGTLGYKKYEIGERINWYSDLESGDGSPGFAIWGVWGYPLANAYLATGDIKYAKAILSYARSFYKNVRPPAQLPKTWFGYNGPWSAGGHNRMHPEYLPRVYRAIAGCPIVTDADRVMFLKMFYEHGDLLYQITEKHQPHNFEVQICDHLLNVVITFPEFKESVHWRERAVERLSQNMRDTTLADGGSWERTGYHFTTMRMYAGLYRRLLNANVPVSESFRQGLKKMYDYSIWILTPTLQYPLFGHGSPFKMQGDMDNAAQLFPEHADFVYVASGGKKGQPPTHLARDLFHAGFAVMRSDWSPDALYMAMNYNGSPLGIDHHPELLSFALQAHGRLYMTNSGTTSPYGSREEVYWNEHTISSNTVLVDDESQKQVDNGGRLEIWESHPGFNYISAVSDGYRWLGVRHRRAVLFMKPFFSDGERHGYWLIYDRLDSNGKPHEYRWLGHFQPTELTVDTFTKTVSTKAEDGKRLYLISGERAFSHFGMEQGRGPINTEEKNGAIGPYISLVKRSADPVAFSVLLYPATKEDEAPVFETLPVAKGEHRVKELLYDRQLRPRGFEEAICRRVVQGEHEDILALAQSPGLRTYGHFYTELITDGEVAYVRRDKGQVIEAGLVRGQRLAFGGETLIQISPKIASIQIRYAGDTVEVSTRGAGEISVARMSASKIKLNGGIVSVKEIDGMMKIEPVSVGLFTLSVPIFSTDPSALCHAIGIPYGPEIPPNSWGSYNKSPENSVLLTWKTSVQSDAEIEYRQAKSDVWERTAHGEPLTEHGFVISNLEPDKTYEFRITCRNIDGGLVIRSVEYRYKR